MNKIKEPIYKLDLVIANMPGYLFWKNKDSVYMGCNLNLVDFLGLNKIEEIIGKSDRDFYWSADLAEQFVADDKQTMLEQITLTKEYQVKRFDRSTVLLRVDRTPLYNEEKQVIGVLAIGVDITRQKLAENQACKTARLLEDIIFNLPGLIYWKNKQFQYIGFNKNVVLLSGLTREELYGKTDLELNWGKEEAQIFQAADKEIMKRGTVKSMENKLPIKRPDGHSMLVKTEKARLCDRSGNLIGVLGVALDITDKKIVENNLIIAKEKAEVANQAKNEFLENMRHDIRTPLTGIVGCAQLIQMQSGLPEKVTEFANDLVESSHELLAFLNEILESITVASGEIPLLKKRFNLKVALEQMVRLNKPQAIVKKLALNLKYDETIPTYLIGDAVRIQRIILELLTNALKYTDKGSVTVSAGLLQNKEREVIIELRVTDTGMGIPGDKHHEVYTRFKRLTPAYEGIYPGTGLGLSLVKQFIDDLKGEIHIESELHQGTRFICLIPFQKSLLMPDGDTAELKASDVFPHKEFIAEPLTCGSRILVVEDNVIAAKVAQNIFSSFGCQIDGARDRKTALGKIQQTYYDLVLMDMGLPDGEGYEIALEMRLQQSQPNPTVPIIGLTAHIKSEKEQQCFANGMNAVFTKPLTSEKASEILSLFVFHQTKPRSITHDKRADYTASSSTLLDIERAVKLLGKKKFVEECLDLLASTLGEDLEIIQQSHKEKDWSAISAMAHKWTGGSNYCGARRLEKVCRELEVALKNKSPEEVEVYYQQLLTVAEATIEAARTVVFPE